MTTATLPFEPSSKDPMTVTDGTTSLVARTPTGAVIRPRGPFSLDRTRAFTARWEPTSLEAGAVDEPLRLTAALDGDGSPVGFAVTQDDSPDGVSGDVHVEVSGTDRVDDAVDQLARVLSLDHDARDYPEVGRRLPAVGTLMAAEPGLRPTLFGSPYEAAAWGVLSARISMNQAAAVHRRLAGTHGHALDVAGQVRHAFPRPQALLGVDEVPGLAAEKVRRLHGIARAALDGHLDVDRLRALGSAGAQAQLQQLRGIGPFWSAGIWLRACGVVDEFPTGEPRCRTALAHLDGRPDDADVTDLVELLRPYRMWVALLLRWAG